MARKISATLFAASLLVLAAPAISAHAATISNGVACSKSGAVTKVGSFKYQCAKNPMVKNSKLTWLSTDCLKAANDYVTSSKAAANVQTEVNTQIASIDVDIKAAQDDIVEIQAKLATATSRAKIATDKMNAAATDADKKLYQTAVNSWNAAIRSYQAAIDRDNQSIRKLTNDRTNLANKPKDVANNIASAKANAQLICQKGL